MASAALPPYGELPDRIAQALGRLRDHPDPDVANSAVEVETWTDAFNRVGVGRLLDMIRAWRGEIFLDAVFRDEVASVFLAHYGERPDPQ